MAMLAEPRRKQKWSVDPRNSAWSNDDSKFGQKMLERMGWSKGKGLGRSEQGATDHIKVRVKNDNYGLGANQSHEDNWIAHQDDFNELLAQLNNCHGQNNSSNSSSDPVPEEQKGFSLEEKSKTSKKRVHYMKFTKGKDLSSRSETDLNCIFGKRSRTSKEPEQESNSSDSQGETEEQSTSAGAELDTESITKTVTSTLSMQEYFAQRMAQLKRARGQTEAETNETSEEPNLVHADVDESDEPKKKKKKKKRATEESEVVEEACSSPIVVEENTNTEEKRSKKKKKRKSEKSADETASLTCEVEQNCEELPPPKKKKHKKRNTETQIENGHNSPEDQIAVAEVGQKKKKKHKDEVDSSEEVVKKSKKNKKKKHQE